MALEANPFEDWTDKMNHWLRPQLFEIGRTEAVHLASPSVDDLKKWIKSNYLDGSALPTDHGKCNGSWATCKNIEPERPPRNLPLNTCWRLSP